VGGAHGGLRRNPTLALYKYKLKEKCFGKRTLLCHGTGCGPKCSPKYRSTVTVGGAFSHHCAYGPMHRATCRTPMSVLGVWRIRKVFFGIRVLCTRCAMHCLKHCSTHDVCALDNAVLMHVASHHSRYIWPHTLKMAVPCIVCHEHLPAPHCGAPHG